MTLTAPTLDPVRLVRALPPEAKTDALIALLEELAAWNPGSQRIFITTLDGQSLGYYVPPAAEREERDRFFGEMPPDVREQMRKPLPADFDPDDCLTDEEIDTIRREVDRKATG